MSEINAFPNLFSPAKIGTLELRNRMIMSLYPTKYPTDGKVNARYIEFWRARAKGGVALIVLDGACLDYPALYKGGAELRMDSDEYVEGLKRLLDAVQGGGARGGGGEARAGRGRGRGRRGFHAPYLPRRSAGRGRSGGGGGEKRPL